MRLAFPKDKTHLRRWVLLFLGPSLTSRVFPSGYEGSPNHLRWSHTKCTYSIQARGDVCAWNCKGNPNRNSTNRTTRSVSHHRDVHVCASGYRDNPNRGLNFHNVCTL